MKMQRSQDEFWNSYFSQIIIMIDMYTDEAKMKNALLNDEDYESVYFNEKPKNIASLREIEGLV